jgi:hypothetical protein
MPADFVLILILGCMFSCVVGCAAAMAGQRYERRKWERVFERAGRDADRADAPSRGAAAEARLERLEQAVDAIAVEMERVGEGQRFVTKLLAERKTDSATPASSSRSPIPGAVRPTQPPA